MNTIFIRIMLLALLVGITACNTMEGLGKDVGAAGDEMEDSAQKHKNY